MRKENLEESFGWQINKLSLEAMSFGMNSESLEVHVFPLMKLDERLSHFAPNRLSVLRVDDSELISVNGGIIENIKLLDFSSEEEDVEKLYEFIMLARKTNETMATKKLWEDIKNLLSEEDGLMLNLMGVVELRENREGKSREKVRMILVVNPKEIGMEKKWFTESIDDSIKRILGARIFFKKCWGVFGEEYRELTDLVLGEMAKKRARELMKKY